MLPTVRSASAQTPDINAAMMAANRRGDFKSVQALLDEGADPNVRDRRGRTAFMETLATSHNRAALQFWERQKIDVNARDNHGVTLLMVAARAGQPDVVTFLLDHGAHVNARDRRRRTALIMTVAWSNFEVKTSEDSYVEAAERLLAHGADINARSWTGWTALTYAVDWRHPLLLQMLLRHGADVNLGDQSGCTALAMAASLEGDNETVQALRQHGARIGLIEAILLKDHAAVQRLLAGKVDFTERGPNEDTALMLAAEEGDLALVRALLAKGAAPNARRYDGMTALMLAFARGEQYGWSGGEGTYITAEDAMRLPIVDALLKAGARVNAHDRQGRTPLFWALKVSTLAVVRRLLEAGANVNAADRRGTTPLMASRRTLAFMGGGMPSVEAFNFIRPWDDEKALVEMLLAQGARINAQNRKGDTVLHQIVKWIFLDLPLLSLMLEHGVDVNRRNREGQTALMLCSRAFAWSAETTVKVAQSLMEKGANAFLRDRDGNTALTFAIQDECKPLVEMLREKGLKTSLMDAVLLHDASTVRARLVAGANVNATTVYGETALMYALQNSDVEIARTLLARGAKVNAGYVNGTALRQAAAWSNTEMVRLLLAHGTDVNARYDGDTALMDAAQRGESEMVQALLAYGADVNASNRQGLPILLMAVRGGASDSLENSSDAPVQERPYRLEVVQALLEHHATVDAASENGVTPLLMTAALGNTEIVRLLLAHGADPNLADMEGRTPLALARDRNHADIVALLKQAGAKYSP